MKNIHVIPTDKPSRLFYYNSHLGLARYIVKKNDGVNTQHIYITSSDEVIKFNDYITDGYKVLQWKDDSSLLGRKKIILTTDQDLNGVQAISKKFLEWFIKNPSCEEVEVHKMCYGAFGGFYDAGYKIIIPKEEQKQHLIDMMKDDEELGLYEDKSEKPILLEDDFMVWDDLFGILAWKFKPTKSGDMYLDGEAVYNELKEKFYLRRK